MTDDIEHKVVKMNVFGERSLKALQYFIMTISTIKGKWEQCVMSL